MSVIVDASISKVNLIGISHREKVCFTFTILDEGIWLGNFSFSLFNSESKDTKTKIKNAISVNKEKMELTISPALQGIDAGEHFYEIFDEKSKRVIFFGKIKIKP